MYGFNLNPDSYNPYNTFATWCKELTYWKRLWCWERLKAGGEGDDRGWDVWMASQTQWMWVWVNCRSWRWTRRPGVLQSLGHKESEMTEQLNWTESIQTVGGGHWEKVRYPNTYWILMLPRFDPWVGKIPWRRKRLPTPIFWPGEFHGLCSP